MAARAAGQQEHIPVLWYYHHLTFLDENKDDEGSTGTASEIIDNSIKIEEVRIICYRFYYFYTALYSRLICQRVPIRKR